MEKFLEGVLLLILFILLGSCQDRPEKTGTLMDYVPEGVSVVFKISDWETLQADIEHSSLLKKFDHTLPYSFFSERAPLLKILHPNSLSLLCINKVNDSVSAYTFISKQNKNLFQTDSLKDKTIETLKIDEHSIKRITIDKNIAYSAAIDSVFVTSSSQQLLIEILKGKTERDKTFKKVYNLPSAGEFTALLRGDKVVLNDSTKINFSSWSALDVSVAPESLTATGITLATDSIPQLLTVFDGQKPQQNDVASIVPMNALGALSFTFNDAEKFQNNLQNFREEKKKEEFTGIFGSVNEVGTIQLKEETAVFLKSLDPSLTTDALARFVSAHSSFREIEIKTFSEPELFQKTFSPLLSVKDANYMFPLENFFVFTQSENAAQQIIAAFQNNSTLKNTPYFENTSPDLGSSSSLVIYKMQGGFSKALSGFFNTQAQKGIAAISLHEFPLAVLQFTFDRNFAHVAISCREDGGSTKNVGGGISEKFSIQLKNPILGNPQLFENGNGSNAVVQDIGNELYYISENGKILWTKNLRSAILGTIQEIDIFNNGNKQMAFATKNAIYVLDRNGKEVKPFPLKFRDDITQPLAVFDYDGNHKYRFVVVQDKEVLMYDKHGKTVKGFGFAKAKNTIVAAPIHIRMGNKDYILIPEEKGKLNILSRVGTSRVTVTKKFNFSEIPITEEDNTFVVITKERTKERISQTGKVTSQKLNVDNTYWFTVKTGTKVTLDDNLLRIDGKLAQLPIGVYSHPQVFYIHRKTYITITETQEKKVYIFDKDGKLLDGLPVYGASGADMAADGSKNGLSIVVKGQDNGVIVYSLF